MSAARTTGSAGAWFRREGLALLTDLYQLTMLGGYFATGRDQQQACFELYFRRLPPHNGYCVAAGLQPVLDYLADLHFSVDDIHHLRGLDLFDEAFLAWLATFRFTGTVRAVPEGTLVFPNEPLVQVIAPVAEAQLVETFLLNAINFPTLIATKAARCCHAAEGEPVLEFGLRRAQGPDGGVSGARAAMIGGCAATSNVLAGRLFDLPVRGTMAHSWVMSFRDELEAFRVWLRTYPGAPTLLVDTYDTLESGIPNAITAFREALREHPDLRVSVRLDSGDLAELSKGAHEQLVAAGFEDPLIVASSDLDDDLIADIKRQGARINAWGVGTNLITSRDHPALGGVYKLMAMHDGEAWEPRIKISGNPVKTTNPGRKRVVRYYGADDEPLGDVLHHVDEPTLEGPTVTAVDPIRLHEKVRLKRIVRHEELLRTCIADGEVVHSEPPVLDIRERTLAGLARLPGRYLRLRNPHIYRVLLSPRLATLKRELLEARGE